MQPEEGQAMSPGKRKLKLRGVVANIKAKSYCNMKQPRMVLPAGCDWKEALRPDGVVITYNPVLDVIGFDRTVKRVWNH